MQLSEAARLIDHPALKTGAPVNWADLGCGSGTFTHALSQQLPQGSTVYAIDQSAASLKQVQTVAGIHLVTQVADFVRDPLGLPPLDGILMANSLHYVAEQEAFIESLQGNGKWLIVEYDSDRANQWVPYPVTRKKLGRLFATAGEIIGLGRRPSAFGHADMYAALVLL